MQESPARLERFIERQIQKLRTGKRPETTVRRILELVERKRRHPNDFSRLDELLAQMNIKATPLIRDCVDINTKIRLGWLERPTVNDELPKEPSEPHDHDVNVDVDDPSTYEDVYKIGNLEVNKAGLEYLRSTIQTGRKDQSIKIEHIGRKPTYPRYIPGFGFIGVTAETWNRIERSQADERAERAQLELKRKRWWWPFS